MRNRLRIRSQALDSTLSLAQTPATPAPATPTPMPPAGPRKRGAAGTASANTNSPGQKRLKTENDPSRTPDQSQQQAHLHTTQQGHQLPPPQQYHHPHYAANHAASGNMYGDHNQAVASG